MYDLSNLKPVLTITDSEVSCPVVGCQNSVIRQRKSFTRKPEFHCDEHHIFISPSTFEYDFPETNILWDDECLKEHMVSKRESRIARDNSEDAVTWNVFKYLENNNLLLPYLSTLAGKSLSKAKTIFWSHDLATRKPWECLWKARETFERNPFKGSEPDLIVLTDGVLFFIEAKLNAKNNTVPSSPESKAKYVNGGNSDINSNGWWKTAFVQDADYDQIAVTEKKYELMRFWLLGTWMAEQLNVEFRLINLLRDTDEEEADIESRFGKFLPASTKGNFMRQSWEDICRFIQSDAQDSADKDIILRYFREKSIGYRNGQIQKAFAV